MSSVLPAFPDVEVVLVGGLTQPGRRVMTMTDEGETFETDAVVIERIGGTDDGITDRPDVEISCYSRSRAAAQALTEAVRQEILAMGGTKVGGVLIDKAQGIDSPKPIIDPVRNVRRIVTRYRLAFRL